MRLTNLEPLGPKTVDEALFLLGKKWEEQKYLEHANARTVDEAVSLLSQYMGEAMIIAGGVDLVGLMKNKVKMPKGSLVNIKTIPDLAYINANSEGLRIGSLTTINDIERSAIIRDRYPILVGAAHSVASPQIRNMATIGGNLCQDVRCWYYRRSPMTGRTFFCRRKGGQQCFAVTGENQYHAIMGGHECYAVCPSDMASVLIALDARLKIATPMGEKTVSLEEFYTPLGTILRPNEIITEIQIPSPMPGAKQRYLKFRERKTLDFAMSSVAVVITTEARVISHARIILGGVAPTPYRALNAEEILIGETLTDSTAEMTAKAALREAVPLKQNIYKVSLTKALVKRAIRSLAE